MGLHDLDRIVNRWVKRQIDGQKTTYAAAKKERNGSEIRFDVDWSSIHFRTMSSWIEEEEEKEYDGPRLPMYLPPLPRMPIPKPEPPTQLVFKATYSNETENEQIHSFSMKRSTDSTVVTRLTDGFSRDGDVSIEIIVPEDVASKTGVFGNNIDVDNVDANVLKRSTTWAIDSKVKAAPNKKIIAELRVREDEFNCLFGAKINIDGSITVKIFNTITQRAEIIKADIVDILKEERDLGKFKTDGKIRFHGDSITWTIAGKMDFKFGVSQKVEIWEDDLPSST